MQNGPTSTSSASLAPSATRDEGSIRGNVSPHCDHGAELGLGHDLAADLGFAAEPPHVLAPLDPGHVVLEHVARHDGLAEFGLVDGQEVDERRLGLSRHRADAKRAGGLRHALQHQHARHHRIVGKMAEELRLVGGDVLDADAVFVAADFDDAVDQQERIAVRKRGEDFANPDGLKRLAAHVSISPNASARWPFQRRPLNRVRLSRQRAPTIPQWNSCGSARA